jgi:hypothetical protein
MRHPAPRHGCDIMRGDSGINPCGSTASACAARRARLFLAIAMLQMYDFTMELRDGQDGD